MTNKQIASMSKLDLIQARVHSIPKGWKLDKVGNVLKIRNNLRKPISQEVRSTIQGQYPYYGPTKIQDYISEYEQDGTYTLIGEDGDHFLKYSTMNQTQYISGKCTVNNHAHIIESTKICTSEWFNVYFKNRNIVNFLSRQGAKRYKLNKATLEKLPLLVPPLPEQRKIAKILTTWDKAISTTEALIDNSKQKKKALMQQLLTGKKRFAGFEGEWEEQNLDSIFPVIDSLHQTPSFSDSGYPMIRVTDIKGGNLSLRNALSVNTSVFEEYTKKYQPKFDDIVFSRVGSYGNSSIVQTNDLFCLGQNTVIAASNKIADSHYIYQFLNTEFTKKQIERTVDGSSHKTVSLKIIRNLKILVPTIKEQQKIASVLSNADNEIEILEKQLDDLKQEKKALMQQLLTGKRRVVVNEHHENHQKNLKNV